MDLPLEKSNKKLFKTPNQTKKKKEEVGVYLTTYVDLKGLNDWLLKFR